jgi:type I restriction enzyme S subunit
MKKLKMPLSQILTENSSRFKPSAKEISNYSRVDKIDFSGTIHISNSNSKTDMILVNPDDLLISGINVHKGALNIYKGKEPITATIHYSSYKINRKLVEPEYLILLLRSQYFMDQIKTHVPGGIKTEIKSKHILPLEVEIHDIEDQRTLIKRINGITESVVDLSEEISLQSNYLKMIKSEMTAKIIYSEVNKKKDNDIVDSILNRHKITDKQKTKIKYAISVTEDIEQVPILGAKWVRLGEILSFGPSNGYSPRGVDKVTNQKVLTLTATTSGIFNPTYFKYFNETIEPNSDLWVKRDDILIQRGNTVEYVGIAALVDQDVDVIYPDLMIKIRPIEGILPEYLVHFLNSKIGREFAMKNAKGAQKTMPKINQDVILAWPVLLPSTNVQKNIVDKIKSVEPLITQLGAEVSQGHQYKDRLFISMKESILSLNSQSMA